MKQQTNQQFLWIIRTDPDLHPTLKGRLIDELHGMINVVVVGSNDVKKGSLDGGFRDKGAIDDVTEDSVIFGKLHLVQSYHRTGRENTIVETNLDMDDGLGLNFIETLQQAVSKRFKPITNKRAWLNYCVGRHVEWQYYAPWDESTTGGALTFGSTHICVTAGLSWATMANSAPSFTEAHHLIKQDTKSCEVFKKPYLGCWEQLPDVDMLAIRARTPTSTGMARVLTAEDKWTKEQVEIDRTQWPLLESSFGISPTSMHRAHQYLTDHLGVVVEENLKGQCRKDHSCSEGIKKKLKQILYHSSMWKNKYDIVHIIQTSVDSEMSAHVLDHFSFDSLESQTTYEFLWIIRLQELEESEEIEELLTSKIVGKSPLNVLVVKSDQTSNIEFRNRQAIGDITEETLLYGDMEMLEDYYRAVQNRTLLETTLEAFDALSKTFVEDLQSSTARQVKESEMMDDSKSWYYRCNSRYIEWDFFTPEGYDADSGFLRITGSDDQACVQNPGATRVSLPDAVIPYYSEEKTVPECQVLVVRRIQSGCYIPASSNQTSTARAIIPESVEKPVSHKMDPFELEELVANDGHLRGVLRDTMNIYPATIAELHSHIRESQCSDSLLCNPAWDSEYGVTHVIQTSIRDASDYLHWRHFGLSLESQSTTKFLWIIRISLDPKLSEELVNTIHGITLNVIVAQATSSPVYDFRHQQTLTDINNSTLLYGDLNTLEYFHRSAQRRPLLETYLAPTDSLSLRFVTTLQKLTAAEINERRGGVHGLGAWYYRCGVDHVAWSSTTAATQVDSGVVYIADRDETKCMNHPGTTRISLPGTDIPSSDLDGAAALSCVDGKGWFPNGCYGPFQDSIKAARVIKSKDKNDRGFGGIPGIYNATEVQEWWFQMLRTDFGLHRISLKMMDFKMKQTKSLKPPELWSNKRGIVHVVYSRFLQQQGALLHLGLARLKLFRALCLPSLSEQTNKNFLWVIRTDPELRSELKEGLIDAVKELQNVVVVASDVGVDGFHDGGFRKDEAMDEFNKDSILVGDIKLVQSYHAESKTHTLVETNLDTDDGIALTFINSVQDKVDELFVTDELAAGWVQLCIGNHLEWHFYSPWEKKSNKGCLLKGLTRTCIKSGLSWATRPKSKPQFMKELNILKEEAPECPNLHNVSGYAHQGCWVEVPLVDQENDVMAIRAMSPASRGVARGEISKFDWGVKSLFFNKVAWSLLDPYFYIRVEYIKSVRAHLVENIKEVSDDNEHSKCTHEKTCFGRWANEHRVVHVVYTSIYDPNFAYTWERVSLSSLTRQSSYELLWIVRVADFTDHRIIDSLLHPIEESPFADNIIIVKSTAAPHNDFRSLDAIADITEEKLIYGNLDVVKDYHKASQTRTLIETFLSPEEGLVRTFIDDLQVSALTLPGGGEAKSNTSIWYYRCVPEYLERSYYTPNGEVEENGFLRIMKSDDATCMDQPGTSRISYPASVITSKAITRKRCSIDRLQNGCFIEFEGEAPSFRALLPGQKSQSAPLSAADLTALKSQQQRFVFKLRLVYSAFPPKLTAMKQVMKGNARKIIYIVHTWIHDPSSIVTWRHFCAESLLQQSNTAFLWIIRSNVTSDDLRKSVGNPLKYYFKDPTNVILVKSDETPTADFRSPEAVADITEDSIIRGNPNLVRTVQQATQGRTVIETFLRPEESVNKNFIEDLHRSVNSEIERNHWIAHQITSTNSSELEGLWYFQCSEQYIEWKFFSPVGETLGSGFLSQHIANGQPCSSSPGLTRISLPGSKLPESQIPLDMKKCATTSNKGGCYELPSSTKLVAARALIPETIDGDAASTQKASTPLLGSEEATNKEARNKELLHLLDNEFGVSASTLKIMRSALRDAECEKQNGCTGQWESATGVVHVVYTSLHTRLMVSVWRWFCFALEAQTTKDFLWIIRVDPKDPDLLKEVIKPTVKTPLNLIVVKSDYIPHVDFRQPEAVKDLATENIIKSHGHEIDMLRFYHQKAQTSPLLETFLQPTDALGNSFINDIQVSTADQVLQLQNDTWYYQCVDKHLQWTYFSSTGMDAEFGSFKVVGEEITRQLDRPGTTRVSLPGAQIEEAEGDPKTCPASSNGESRHGCYVAVSKGNATSARVIVPKVDMVAHVKLQNEEEKKEEEKYMKDFLHTLKHEYSIGRGNLIQMRKQMKEFLLNPPKPKK
ncbi:unnamed protein product [Cylindrotheca closterium]|uniref:Uncharacterized protein n=1 Tax=Cylindrotheca closterium TaxID=2856 RepID=A0AAD2FNE2_9STRA|nr:unnamed protein product [Cylindrotheca closterium]